MKIFDNSKVKTEVPRQLIFAVRDEKAQSYGPIVTHPQVEVAIRSFKAACKNEQSFLFQFPEDYALYQLGTYDDVSGKVSAFSEPVYVVRASELIQQLMRENIDSKPMEVPVENK